MVVAIIMCYIKEVLTAEGGRGHATQHLAANGFCMGRHIRKNMHTIYSDVFLPRRTQLSSVHVQKTRTHQEFRIEHTITYGGPERYY